LSQLERNQLIENARTSFTMAKGAVISIQENRKMEGNFQNSKRAMVLLLRIQAQCLQAGSNKIHTGLN
jgi:hypothetical protein